STPGAWSPTSRRRRRSGGTAALRCGVVADDVELVARLRAGDEDAFVTLVEQYHTTLLRVAATMVPSRAVAEEVVQETWVGVVAGVPAADVCRLLSIRDAHQRVLLHRGRSRVRGMLAAELGKG